MIVLFDTKNSPIAALETHRCHHAVEVISLNVELASGPIDRNNIEVIGRPVPFLGAYPWAYRVVTDCGGVVDVWHALPGVAMERKHAVTDMAARL